MSQPFEGNVKSIKKVESSSNALNVAVDNALAHVLQAENVEIQQNNHALPKSQVDDDFSPLSGKPYCHCIVTNTIVTRYRMWFPAKLYPDLPSKNIPAVVRCRGKTWEMMFLVDGQRKRFDVQSYKVFVVDNHLKVGDALFWEVMEMSDEKVNFKVQIIRGDFPSELEAKVNGQTKATPMIID